MILRKKMTLIIFGITLIAAATGGAWWFLMHRENPPLPTATATIASTDAAASGDAATDTASSVVVQGENPPLPTEALRVDRASFTVEIASTTLQKMSGLSFRPSLAPDRGMLFLFASSSVQNFWMKDMNFSLDMIWIGGNKVVGFAQNAAPQPGAALWSLTIYSSPGNTDKVLEVPAGTVAKYNIRIGDTVTIGG